MGLTPRERADARRALHPYRPAPGDGTALIAEERARQVRQEGWTPEHDDEHVHFEMSRAAITYATQALVLGYLDGFDEGELWPWDEDWWKPSGDPIRNLVKAGALIAAEIDRLQRAAEREADEPLDIEAPSDSGSTDAEVGA